MTEITGAKRELSHSQDISLESDENISKTKRIREEESSSDDDLKPSENETAADSSKDVEKVEKTASSGGFVFGSAAKSLVTFASLKSNEEKKELFTEEKDSEKSDDLVKDAKKSETPNTSNVETGEEDEVTIESFKTKLFEFSKESKEWIEKGLGTLKLNSCTVNDSYSRISTPKSHETLNRKDYCYVVMRADGVPRVLLNFRLYPELKVDLAQPKNVRLAIVEEGSVRQILLRFRNIEETNKFVLSLEEQIKVCKEFKA